MPVWKLNLFVRVISRRIVEESRTSADILDEYPALTVNEKVEIIADL